MISQIDLQIIEEQLGRPPRGVKAIETRCPCGHPQVIRVSSLIGEQPFPTLFWLSCPALVAQISQLEHLGLIERLEEMIQADSAFREAYKNNHREYIAERWAAMSPDEIALIDKKTYRKLFDECGIGGIRNWEAVKCLHLHYAHHLARNNVIGQWLDENFQFEFCK